MYCVSTKHSVRYVEDEECECPSMDHQDHEDSVKLVWKYQELFVLELRTIGHFGQSKQGDRREQSRVQHRGKLLYPCSWRRNRTCVGDVSVRRGGWEMVHARG
jgi:hypothetical protein